MAHSICLLRLQVRWQTYLFYIQLIYTYEQTLNRITQHPVKTRFFLWLYVHITEAIYAA